MAAGSHNERQVDQEAWLKKMRGFGISESEANDVRSLSPGESYLLSDGTRVTPHITASSTGVPRAPSPALVALQTSPRADILRAHGVAPANDTTVQQEAGLQVGQTREIHGWRVHRYASALRITELANAGKRGKKVAEITLNDRDYHGLHLNQVPIAKILQAGHGPSNSSRCSRVRTGWATTSTCDSTGAAAWT
jgi:hypothetical protein